MQSDQSKELSELRKLRDRHDWAAHITNIYVYLNNSALIDIRNAVFTVMTRLNLVRNVLPGNLRIDCFFFLFVSERLKQLSDLRKLKYWHDWATAYYSR